MTDKLSPERRSENMRRIRSSDTLPELAVRRILRDLGRTGYRLHRRDLPGKPDMAFVGRRKAIFVHGCFWHGHDCKEGLRKPKSNIEYWEQKIVRNCRKHTADLAALEALGWSVLTVWECEVRDPCSVKTRLRSFLNG